MAVHHRVDPGALLVAVFAVTVGPLATDVPWDRLNSIVALLVGVVVFCFIWPHGDVGPFDPWMAVPEGIVMGLIIGIGAAWPMQLITGSTVAGSNGGLVVGLLGGTAYFLLARRQTHRLQPRGGDTAV